MGDKVYRLILTDHDAPGELLVGEGGDVEPVLGQLAQLVTLPLTHTHLGAPNIGPLFACEDSTLKFRTLCSLSAICYPILTQSLAVLGDLAPLLVSTDRTLDPVLLGEHEVGLGRLQLPLVGRQPHPAGPGVLLAGGKQQYYNADKI